MPATTAIVRLTKKVPRASSIVTGRRCRMIVETGSSSMRDSPRSPRRTPPSQSMYWVGSGSFRFRRLRICSLACSVASGPRINVAGSPGIRLIMEKQRTLTMNRRGTFSKTRLTRKAPPLPPLLPFAHVREQQDAVGVGREALHVGLHGEVRRRVRVVEVDVRDVLVQDLHRLRVELLAPRLIARRARLVQEVVHLRVAVAGVVEVAVGGHEVVDVEVGVDPAAPTQVQRLEVAAGRVLEKRPELELLQLDVYAGGLEVVLDDLPHLLAHGRGVGLVREREPVRLPALLQEPLGLLDARLGVGVGLLAVGEGLLAKGRVRRGAADVAQDRLHDGVAVDQAVDGPAQRLVVEGGLLGVEVEALVAEARHLGDLVLAALLQALEVHEGDGVYKVELAALEVLVLDVLVVDAVVDDLVELGLAVPPVVGVLLDGDVVPAHPLDELERAGADRLLGDASAAPTESTGSISVLLTESSSW